MDYDAIIIGIGPAGISASLYLSRAGYSVAAVGKGPGALERAERIDNFYGFPDGIGGLDLVERGIAQAKSFGVTIVREEAISLAPCETDAPCFEVKTSAGTTYRARLALIATGRSRSSVKAAGFERYRGRGIGFCATCDGFFYRGKKLALVGAGEYAASELHDLLAQTSDITVFTDGAVPTPGVFPAGTPIVTEKISAFEGIGDGNAKKLTFLATADGRRYEVDGCFVAVGTAGASEFASKLGIAMNGTDLAVDREFRTNVPGVFAAGDCVGGFMQISKSVSDGALAAKAMIADLKKNS